MGVMALIHVSVQQFICECQVIQIQIQVCNYRQLCPASTCDWRTVLLHTSFKFQTTKCTWNAYTDQYGRLVQVWCHLVPIVYAHIERNFYYLLHKNHPPT